MKLFKSRLGQLFGLGLGLAVCSGFYGGFYSLSLADVVHFANGNSVRGKLDRVTGDIIEFRRSKHFYGNLDYFKRIQVTDRHDVVETHDGQKYFGEIIYLDDFLLEIQTASGAVRINRMNLTSVVLGSPVQTPNVPAMNQLPTQQAGLPPEPPGYYSDPDQPSVRTTPMTTISNTRPAKADPSEDEDAIPAVNK